MKTTTLLRRVLVSSATVLAASALSGPPGAYAQESGTATPIRHVIIVVGENHTFDNVCGTYQPKGGQKIGNLLAKGIVNADGTHAPNVELARQRTASDRRHPHAHAPHTAPAG